MIVIFSAGSILVCAGSGMSRTSIHVPKTDGRSYLAVSLVVSNVTCTPDTVNFECQLFGKVYINGISRSGASTIHHRHQTYLIQLTIAFFFTHHAS